MTFIALPSMPKCPRALQPGIFMARALSLGSEVAVLRVPYTDVLYEPSETESGCRAIAREGWTSRRRSQHTLLPERYHRETGSIPLSLLVLLCFFFFSLLFFFFFYSLFFSSFSSPRRDVSFARFQRSQWVTTFRDSKGQKREGSRWKRDSQ